jgi:hypothetical protein
MHPVSLMCRSAKEMRFDEKTSSGEARIVTPVSSS